MNVILTLRLCYKSSILWTCTHRNASVAISASVVHAVQEIGREGDLDALTVGLVRRG